MIPGSNSNRTYQQSQQSPPLTSDVEDLDLARQLQNGNHNALTSLFEKYSDMVFGIARRMLGDDGEAEEVVQQVFLDSYRAIDQFDPAKGSYKTWLFQYAYHRTIHRKKHLKAKGFYSSEELDLQDLGVETYDGALRSLRLCSQEVVQLVHQLLNSIQPRQRVAIELTFFEGLTAEEIARQTGETASTVRHNLYRGLSKLRATLLESERCQKSSAKGEIERIFLADPAQ
ncbi:MAG TPA: sigma-70 family RNA polymerase sigma factor [Candidatus Angelobacter sp.]